VVVDDFEIGSMEDVWRKDPVIIGADDEGWFGDVLEELCEFGGVLGFGEWAADFAGSFFEECEGGLICEYGVQCQACVCEEVEAVAGDSAAADENGIGEGVVMVICHGCE
jgi:hypothetical protein